jgi:hypothetical protein
MRPQYRKALFQRPSRYKGNAYAATTIQTYFTVKTVSKELLSLTIPRDL